VKSEEFGPWVQNSTFKMRILIAENLRQGTHFIKLFLDLSNIESKDCRQVC
jgi:hypothetical protein